MGGGRHCRGRNEPGGIARLIWILNDGEALGALESDLDRFYRIDIRGLFTRPRRVTLRQVIVRIRHLPADSALAIRGLAGEAKNSFYDYMWVSVVNELRVGNFMYASAHSGKDRKPEKPNLIELE